MATSRHDSELGDSAEASSYRSPFHELQSPLSTQGRKRRSFQSPMPKAQQKPSPPLSNCEMSLLDAEELHIVSRIRTSTSLAGHTREFRHSETNSELYRHSYRRITSSAVSAHSSRPFDTSLPPQDPLNCTSFDVAERGRETQHCGTAALPSYNYYVDSGGQRRIKKLWWFYMKLRRVLWCVFPWLKRDSNTYLCAKMVANSTLIMAVYLLKKLLNYTIVPRILEYKNGHGGEMAKHCYDHSVEFLNMYVYSLIGNVFLCLPALNYKACRLYKRTHRQYSIVSSTSSSSDDVTKEELPFEKTYLFTLCELIVVLETPYLLLVLIAMFIPSKHGSISEMLRICNRQLTTGNFLVFLLVQLAAVVAFVLRWRQILLFHQLHQHFLFQRGYVSGHLRFDYVEKSFAAPLYAWLPTPVWDCWQCCKRLVKGVREKRYGSNQDDENILPRGSTKKQIRHVKVLLYSAAKRGDVGQVRALLETAIDISGPEFAREWYEPRVWNFGGLVLLACGQRNPLHVAVAFNQVEVAQELLANGHFDVQQLDKLELLRLDLAWLYRLVFRVLFSVVRRSSAGVVTNASAGFGTGNGRRVFVWDII